jgi:hypothetical protein
MRVLDFVEAWWLSVRAILEAAGVVVHFERSPGDILNPSCHLNLRHGELEADLLVWDSGDAELAIVKADGSLHQKHFDDIRNPQDLGEALSRLALIARPTSPK